MIIQSLYNALSGHRTASRKLETSANNVANLQTPGFKKGEAQIADNATGGSQVLGIGKSTGPGALIPSSDPFSLAVNGDGFFQVSLSGGGTGYTRAGNFKVDANGQLTNLSGDPLTPAISVPQGATSVGVSQSGQVTAQVGGTSVTLGNIELADFNNPGGLTAQGGNLFTASPTSGTPVSGLPGTGGRGTLVSGALESSNVNLAEEAVNQIVAKTAFKANAKVIKASDDLLGTLLDIKS